MADTAISKTSKRMASIHSKDTKVEWMLRTELWKSGLRYRTHYDVVGRPDVAFPSQKLAVFIDGDFWHGWNWRKLRPKLKSEFWVNKIVRNMERDRGVDVRLRRQGWKVLRIWEHDIRQDVHQCVQRVQRELGVRGRMS